VGPEKDPYSDRIFLLSKCGKGVRIERDTPIFRSGFKAHHLINLEYMAK